MHGLARVFFQVGTHQTHGVQLIAHVEAHFAALHHGNLELGDLVALGQVRVEVVLARKNAAGRDVAAQRQAELDGAFHRLLVHHRQGAGQGHVHGAGLGVGLGTKGGAGAAEDFGVGRQLGVGFKADDDFVPVDQFRSHDADVSLLL